MQHRISGSRKPTSFFALFLGLALAVYAQVSVGFRVDSDWGSGANVTFTITNNTAAAINNWILEFDFASSVSPYSSAALASRVGNHHTLTNLAYAVIPANGTLAFQCGATPGNLGTNQPANYVLNGASAGGGGGSAVWPALTVADAQMSEGNAGLVSLAIPVTLNAAPTQQVTVAYSTTGITAVAGTDFLVTNGVLTFLTGQTQQWIYVTVVGDTEEEADETFAVTLANPTNATLARAMATATILNDDIILRLSVNDASVFEGNSGLTPATFILSLNATSAAPVAVSVSTADVTAVAGMDYLATNFTVNFSPGQLTQAVTVYVLGNTNQQLARTFALNLSSPVGAVIQDSQGLGTIMDDDGNSIGKPSTGAFNYAEALQKSLFFFECQRAGTLPPGNRVTWRGNAATADGSDVGRDLTGGWFDAGDHVKFGLPMAASATLLAWGGIEYANAFVETGQLPYLLDNLKWACDYFMKCDVTDANGETLMFFGQVGSGSADHAWWGPAEVMAMARPSYAVTRTAPGSDLTGETAAALAACSMLFQNSNPVYASNLLAHAKKLYKFADTYRGKYSDTITDAQAFYNSWSGYMDELMWGGLWLYRATSDTNYLAKAQAAYANIFTGNWGDSSYPSLKWTHAWDDKTYGSLVLFSELTTNAAYRVNAERFLDFWTVGRSDGRIPYTPGGLAYLDQWGSLRYANNTAFLALIYSDRVNDYTNRYRSFALSQLNYTLGLNPRHRSFMCGFGTNPPVNPHHRSGHGSWDNNIYDPPKSRHVLYGAVVGGPDSTDNYTDARDNYTANEVACDYNAALTGALARLYQLYGGYTLDHFPEAETSTNQFFVLASLNQTNAYFTEIRALLENQSAWPARPATNLHYRYFVNLSELYAAGGTTNNVTITINMAGGGSFSGLRAWDESNRIYYIEAGFDGMTIVPGGSTSYRAEAQFRLGIPNSFPASAWNPANDWSYQGLLYGNQNVTNTGRLVTYMSGVKLEGVEPPRSGSFATWQSLWFTAAELGNPGVSGDSVDPNHNGYPNFVEYAMGLNPKSIDASLLPRLQVTNISGQPAVTFTYGTDASATEAVLYIDESTNLVVWTPAETQTLWTTNTGTRVIRQVRLQPAENLESQLYLRLHAEKMK